MTGRFVQWRTILPPLFTGFLVLAVWQGVCRLFAIQPILFPAPSDIAIAFWADGPKLLRELASTMEVTLVSFGLAVVIGVAIAFLFVQSPTVERSLFPYVIMLQVTPIVAIAPLVIILVKNTHLALVICATVVALFPIISNTTLGLRTIDPGLRDLFAIYKANRLQTLLRLRIPSALPYFFAGLRISSGLALIGAVVAEFVAGTGGTSAGLAYEIMQSSFELAIPRMFAALFLITAAGIMLYLAMAGLSRWVLGAWHDGGRRFDL